MQVESLLNRAMSAANQGIRYKLGMGGMKPTAALPAAAGQCDCSGYVAWCLGLSRKTDHPFYVTMNGGWLETTAISSDIQSTAGFFEPLAQPKRGCIVVYPDKISGGVHTQGHIGIVVDVAGGLVSHVVHCSKGNDTQHGDAIRVTGAGPFAPPKAVFYGWMAGLQD